MRDNRDEPNEFLVDFPFVNVLRFHYLSVELKKQNWRSYLRHDNPIAAALLSKMGYTKHERIEVKKEFFKMLIRLQLDRARETLITGFFETYLQLDEQEEQQFKKEVKSMNPKEGEKIMEIMTSYERKGREEGKQQGKIDVAKIMLEKGKSINEILDLTGLRREEIEKLKKESE